MNPFDQPIFDARVMPPAPAYSDTSSWRKPGATAANVRSRGWAPPASLLTASMSMFEQECGDSGIVAMGLPARISNHVWGSAPNDAVRDLAEEDMGSRIWYAALDHLEPPDRVAEAVSQGARGLVVEPFLSATPAHIDDVAVDPMYDAAQALGVPVLVMLGGEYGLDLTWCDPVRIERLAARFPQLDIVVVHAAWPLVQAMVGVAYRQPRIWLLPDVYFPGMPGQYDLVLAMRTFLHDRVIYGSGYPFCPQGEQLAAIAALDLPPTCQAAFLYSNAARLFGTPDAIPQRKEMP